MHQPYLMHQDQLMRSRGLIPLVSVSTMVVQLDASGSGSAGAAGAVGAAEAELLPEQACLLFKAFADPVRLAVVQALGGGERCVCDLTSELGLAQSRLSFHLRVLRDAGLIESRDQGRWVYYRLCPQAITSLQDWLAALAQRCHRPAQPCVG